MVKLGEWAGEPPSEARRDLHEGPGDGRVEIIFGVLPDGTVVHVENVERGKKCNCVCAACRRPLVAYKRPPMALHFKHAAEEKKGCKNAPETNMHFYAKQLVYLKKRLLPDTPTIDDSGYPNPRFLFGKEITELNALKNALHPMATEF
ncbi:hypothetical protein [Ferrovibrio sp.]|uniref:hypothetical protein n=1 Tax=Ferrovibrio sp. TaxID=1917215 RepID=UPI002632B6AB|nr:hypothetical protein [Ferrovibrio sp.]